MAKHYTVFAKFGDFKLALRKSYSTPELNFEIWDIVF